MANTKNHRWIELFHPISGPAPPRMLRTAVPGLTSLWSANAGEGLASPILHANKRPSTGAPFAQRRAPGLTIPVMQWEEGWLFQKRSAHCNRSTEDCMTDLTPANP